MKNKFRIYLVISGLIFIFLTWCQTFLVNYTLPLGVAAIVASLVNLWVMKKQLNTKKRDSLFTWSTTIFIAAEILWMVFNNILLFVIAQTAFAIISFVLFSLGLDIHKKENKSRHSTVLATGKWAILIVLNTISTLMIVLTFTPRPITWVVQTFSENDNYMEAEEPTTTTVFDENYQLTNDIQYDDTYPRSYLDVITPAGEFDESRPTFFYVHGGGFIGGDKLENETNPSAEDNYLAHHLEKAIDHGYNVVTMNYALAPEYLHPVPVKQMTEAIQFMQENGQQYGFNMDDVVISGSSAGGHIAADFMTIQANPEYAEQTGIDPVMDLENIRALSLDVPPVDPTRAHETYKESVFSDYLFGQATAAYLDEPLISHDEELLSSVNLIPKITSNFPPTFISDGNTGSFADQSVDYYNRLQELGVESDIYIPDIEKSEETHTFMTHTDSEAVQIYTNRKFDFLNNLE